MQLKEEDVRLLIQIGFTETQAKLYLCLICTGKMDAKSLSKQAAVPRQAAYRALGELQTKGLVEKIVAIPQKYKAIPIQDGLSIVLDSKAKEYANAIEKTREFLLKFNEQKEKTNTQSDYNISIVEGKDVIIKRTKAITETVQSDVEVCSTLQRWTHINVELFEAVEKAMEKGAKYRVVLEKPKGKVYFPKEVQPMLAHPNYEVHLIEDRLKINAAIFDGKEASVSLYPSMTLAESPMIWTNHPSLIVGFQAHFKNLWQTSKKMSKPP